MTGDARSDRPIWDGATSASQPSRSFSVTLRITALANPAAPGAPREQGPLWTRRGVRRYPGMQQLVNADRRASAGRAGRILETSSRRLLGDDRVEGAR